MCDPARLSVVNVTRSLRCRLCIRPPTEVLSSREVRQSETFEEKPLSKRRVEP
jgi:hypothetical protein